MNKLIVITSLVLLTSSAWADDGAAVDTHPGNEINVEQSRQSQMGQSMGQQQGMPMMKMMQKKSAEMKQHQMKVEQHLAEIAGSLKLLVEQQKTQ